MIEVSNDQSKKREKVDASSDSLELSRPAVHYSSDSSENSISLLASQDYPAEKPCSPKCTERHNLPEKMTVREKTNRVSKKHY